MSDQKDKLALSEIERHLWAAAHIITGPIVCLMANILNPQSGKTVYDPACGTGGMLNVHNLSIPL